MDRQALLDQLEIKRRNFARGLGELQQQKISYLDRARELPQALLDNCRLVQNRLEMVKLLPKNCVIAEIGTDRGIFAKHMLTHCAPAHLHIFELDVSRIDEANLADGKAKGIVTIHEGDSAERMSAMDDGMFDWIYIDGDHFYEGVKRDIHAAVPKLKEGGHLVFNDYTTWSPSSMSRCGVAKAVNEFCIENDWELVYLAFQSLMYNDLVIRKRR